MRHQEVPNLKIQVKTFLKCLLWPIVVKLESVGTKFFYRNFTRKRVDEKDVSNFDSDTFTCDPAVFLAENSPNGAQSNAIFPGNWRVVRALIEEIEC